MKATIITLFFTAIYSYSYSQYLTVLAPQDSHFESYNLNPNHNGGEENPVILKGSPLLNTNWGEGAVLLNDGKQLAGIPLQFSIQNNQLYFRKDSSSYAFPNNVRAFKMTYKDGATKKEVYFRSGYPNRIGKPTSFLYQVINDGPKVHFLKRLQSNVDKHYTYSMATNEVFFSTTEYSYLYIVDRNLLLLFAKNKNSILKALPMYRDEVEKFAKTNNYNFTNDKEINQLVTYLNMVNKN